MRHTIQTMECWSSDSEEAELDSKEGKYDSKKREREKSQKNRNESAYIYCHSNLDLEVRYGGASIRRLLQIVGLFCKRALKKNDVRQNCHIISRSLRIVTTPYLKRYGRLGRA